MNKVREFLRKWKRIYVKIAKKTVDLITSSLMNGPRIIQGSMVFLLENIDNTYKVKTPRGYLKISVSNGLEKWRADTLLTKEPETISWLEKTLTPHSVFYDVGANIGLYSLYAAHIFPKQVRIVSFEPESLNFARLNKNIYINNFSKQILPLSVALGKHSHLSEFLMSTFEAGRALHSERYVKRGQDVHRQGCLIKNLDMLIKEHSLLPFPTHLKIDVDGPELDILLGAIETLKNVQLEHLLVEISEEERNRVLPIISQCGFHLVEEVAESPLGAEHNHIFVKKIL